LGYISAAESIGISSNYFYVMRPELTNWLKLLRGQGYYAVQGHSRSPSLVPIESAYATSY